MESFQRNESVEQFIAHLNHAVRIGESDAVKEILELPEHPVLFIVGAPRSGTTVLMQWLANWGQFGIPTNLLARFFETPYIGGLIQRLLTDPSLGYLDELSVGELSNKKFNSQVGKTAGVLAPHEFFYFWRRFFPLDRGRVFNDTEREQADPQGFAQSLAQLEHSLQKPLAMKAIIMQYELSMIAAAIPQSIFLFTSRDEVANCESILESRKRVHGSIDEWFSVMPPGAEIYLEEDPITQVAAQVALTNDSIDSQLSSLAPNRVVKISHEHFCENPQAAALEIINSTKHCGCEIAPHKNSVKFEVSQRNPVDRLAIERALENVRAANPSSL